MLATSCFVLVRLGDRMQSLITGLPSIKKPLAVHPQIAVLLLLCLVIVLARYAKYESSRGFRPDQSQ